MRAVTINDINKLEQVPGFAEYIRMILDAGFFTTSATSMFEVYTKHEVTTGKKTISFSIQCRTAFAHGNIFFELINSDGQYQAQVVTDPARRDNSSKIYVVEEKLSQIATDGKIDLPVPVVELLGIY